MSDPRSNILAKLARARMVASLPAGLRDPATAAHAAVDAGFAALEVNVHIRGWRELLDELPGPDQLMVGLGGLLTAEDMAQAEDADVDFLATPVLEPAVVQVAHRKDIPCLVGALTPTEAHAAREAGADLIRLGPIELMGGAAFLRELRGPLPDLPLAASGIIAAGDVAGLLAAGASVVCIELEESGGDEPLLSRLRAYIAASAG